MLLYSNHLNIEHLNTGLFNVRFSNGNLQHNNGNHATKPFKYRTFLFGIQMPFENQTIRKPDNFWPFEYRTSPVFRWLLYNLFNERCILAGRKGWTSRIECTNDQAQVWPLYVKQRLLNLVQWDLNSELVQYSNGPKQFARRMVHYSSYDLKSKLIVHCLTDRLHDWWLE